MKFKEDKDSASVAVKKFYEAEKAKHIHGETSQYFGPVLYPMKKKSSGLVKILDT